MLLVLLAIFVEFNAGQLQSGYGEQVITRIDNKANAYEVAHEASLGTVESARIINVAATPSKIRYGMSHETMQLKPVITGGSIRTITHNTRTIPIVLEKTVHAGESTKVFDIAPSPSKIQLDIAHETVNLKPRISKVFYRTSSGITKDANQDIASIASVRGFSQDGSVNVISAAAPFRKVQLNLESDTMKLKPKISNVFSHAFSKSQEENQRIVGRTHIEGINKAHLYAGDSTNLIKIAAPPSKIQLDIKHETMNIKPKILNVVSQSVNEIIQEANKDITSRTSVDGINHEESVNVVKVVEPPPKVHLDIQHETMEIKPKIASVFSETINGITQKANEDIASRTSVDGINHEESMNVVKVVEPPPKVHLNIQHETMELKPKISSMFSETINGITQKANEDIASRTSVDGINHEDSMNVVKVVAPPPKIHVDIKHEAMKIKPKIASVFSQSIKGITQEANEDIASKTNVGGINHEGSVNVIKVAAPFSNQLNMEHETIKLKPRISNVLSQTISKISQEENQNIAGRTHIQGFRPDRYAGKSTNLIKIVAPLPHQLDLNRKTVIVPQISNVISQTTSEITQSEDMASKASLYGVNKESVNVMKVAGPLSKVRLNMENGAINFRPKISNVFSHTISGTTQGENQGIAGSTHIQGNRLYAGDSTDLIKLVAPFSPQLNLRRKTVIMPKISSVISQTTNGIAQETNREIIL